MITLIRRLRERFATEKGRPGNSARAVCGFSDPFGIQPDRALLRLCRPCGKTGRFRMTQYSGACPVMSDSSLTETYSRRRKAKGKDVRDQA